MTNPFVVELVLPNKKIELSKKCFHKYECVDSDKKTCENINSISPKTVTPNYIDQCCCVKNPCINSYGFKSDEFKINHEGKHILFAGCSYTHGSGVTLEEVWAYGVYKNISEKEKCSGYFNIGFPNTTIQEQSYMMFKYFEKFGNPEVVFWMMPPTSRGFSNFQNNDLFEMTENKPNNHFLDVRMNEIISHSGDTDTTNYIIDINEMGNYFAYFQVYHYCKSNNIKLYSFTWRTKSKPKSNYLFWDFNHIENFETFYSWETNEMISFIENFSKNYKGKYPEYLQISRDGQHLGIAPQAFWADFIYNKYKEKNIDNA